MSAASQMLADSFNHALSGIAEHAEAKARARKREWLVNELNETYMANAANLAEKHALRAALAKYCPDHPLLQNVMLQEKVKEAGRRAFGMTNNFDAAREAGNMFKL